MTATTPKPVRLTKIAAVDDPARPTPEFSGYIPGQYNGPVSLPVSYTAEGYLVGTVEIGRPVVIDRRVRNGEALRGLLMTTTVKELTADGFLTENSRYRLEEISEFSAK